MMVNKHKGTDAYQSRVVNGRLEIFMANDDDDNDDDDWQQGNDSVNDNDDNDRSNETIPESVLQYERQLRKLRAASRASAPLTKEKHLDVLHVDPHVVVCNKPSGVLSVPGVNKNPSLLTLVYDTYGYKQSDEDDNNITMTQDQMIVHRLDMDTSGVMIFARTKRAVSTLQRAFRERGEHELSKHYQALVCGHVPDNCYNHGLVDLALQRDHERPPFMRVSTASSERAAARAVRDLQHHGYKKLIRKRPKQSKTEWKVLSREYLFDNKDLPVTRLSLTPITGRTHQLRVHCAAMGHAIVGDPAYGIFGEASANGGFDECVMNHVAPQRASLALQKEINSALEQVRNRKKDNLDGDGEATAATTTGGAGEQMCLHAHKLSLKHPITEKVMTWEAPVPF